MPQRQNKITLNYENAMAEQLGERGLSASALKSHLALFEPRLHDYSFWRLAFDELIVGTLTSALEQVPKAIEHYVLLGMGGASLGARAIHSAIGTSSQFHVIDNLDSMRVQQLTHELDPKKTLVVVVSKSGSTLETMALCSTFRTWLETRLGASEWPKHMIAVTDPGQNAIRESMFKNQVMCLDHPADVGGRYSVLSVVGLLPTLLMKASAADMLRGARDAALCCARAPHAGNPAATIAALHILHHQMHGRGVHVMMPYCENLGGFASWFVQLWAESLGKREDRGPTPVAALGARDQHSQLQLFMDGPSDKLITFINVMNHDVDIRWENPEPPWQLLNGVSYSRILQAQQESTAQALASTGKPSLTLYLPKLDAYALGQLFFIYEAATAMAGQMYDVNPFDQPGVELGKKLTRETLENVAAVKENPNAVHQLYW